MNKYDYKNICPFKWFVLENFPFIEDDFDALTNWQLFCKLGKEINKIIKSQNEVGQAVEDFTEKFIVLYNYVHDYFDNLDVQEEINNKLDVMAKDGTLLEIIGSYLDANCLWCYTNVSEMLSASNLVNGSKCKTLGYYSKEDGGAGVYLIRTKTNDDVIDNGKIIKYTDTLVAELIIEDDSVNIKQFGAVGDGSTDDSNAVQNAINSCKNIHGNLNETYLISNISVINKNLYDINIKCLPFEAQVGNTYRIAFDIEGYNNFTNVNVESYFAYTPSINIYAQSTSNVGIASNVQAFRIVSGITNFYKCSAKGCWAFYVNGAQQINVYDFIGTNIEMSFFISTKSKVYVYNSNFTIDKTIDSIYYHHIYQIQGTESQFNNCQFLETGSGSIGNHYHGFSPSFTEDMEVTGRMELNNCTLITLSWAGQLNGSNCIVNGGRIEAANLFTNGNYVNKANAILNNVYIKVSPAGSTSMSYSRTRLNNCNLISSSSGNDALFNDYVEIENSRIILTGTTGTKYFSNYQYKLFNTIIEATNIILSTHIASATEQNIIDRELIIDNCYFKSKSFSWCYPYFCTNIKFSNNTYNLIETKDTTNPVNRNSAGYLFNCIFNNWDTPINANSENTLKYNIIANNSIKSNISN